MKVHPIVVDPYDPSVGMLVPLLTQRILAFSREHVAEVQPEQTARVFMSRLMVLDPALRMVAFIAEDGRMVGHAVATIETDGDCTWAFVWQVHLDSSINAENAVPQALDLLVEWTHEYSQRVLLSQGKSPISQILMATHRDDRAFQKKYGFEQLRKVMIKRI